MNPTNPDQRGAGDEAECLANGAGILFQLQLGELNLIPEEVLDVFDDAADQAPDALGPTGKVVLVVLGGHRRLIRIDGVALVASAGSPDHLSLRVSPRIHRESPSRSAT